MRDCVQRASEERVCTDVSRVIEEDKDRANLLWLEFSETMFTVSIMLEDLACAPEKEKLREAQDTEIRCCLIIDTLRDFLEEKKEEWGAEKLKRAWLIGDNSSLKEDFEHLLEQSEVLPNVLEKVEGMERF